MKTFERRVRKVEERVRIVAPSMTMAKIDDRIDELLAKCGTSRQQVIAQYGSLQAFAETL